MARPRTPAPVSQAERWRAHREEMELALQLGCTPKEARAELDRRHAIERHRREQPAFLARMEARSGPVRQAVRTDQEATAFGIPVVLDPTLEPGTMQMRDGDVVQVEVKNLAHRPRTTPDQTYAATQRLLGERD